MYLLQVNYVVTRDGDELSLSPRNHAVTGDENAGIGCIEVKLHGSEHPRPEAMLGIHDLDFKQKCSGLLIERVAATNNFSVELLAWHFGKSEVCFLPRLQVQCIALGHADKYPQMMGIRDLKELATLRAALRWPTRLGSYRRTR